MILTKTQSELNNSKKNRNIFVEDIELSNIKVEMVDISNSIKSHSKVLSLKFDKHNSNDLIKFKSLAIILDNMGGFSSALSEKTDYYTVEVHFMSNSLLNEVNVFKQLELLKFNTNLNVKLGLKRIVGTNYNKLYFTLRSAVISENTGAESDTSLLQKEDTALQVAAKIKDNIYADFDKDIISGKGEKAEQAQGVIARLKQYLKGETSTFENSEVNDTVSYLKETVEIKNRELFVAKSLIELEEEVVLARKNELAKKKNTSKSNDNQLDIFASNDEIEEPQVVVNDLYIAQNEGSFIDLLNKHNEQFKNAVELKNYVDLDYETRYKNYVETLHGKSLKQVLGSSKIEVMNERLELNDFDTALNQTLRHAHSVGFLSPKINTLNDLLHCKINVAMFVYNNLLMADKESFANKFAIEYLNEKNMFNDETEQDTSRIMYKMELLKDRFEEQRTLIS